MTQCICKNVLESRAEGENTMAAKSKTHTLQIAARIHHAQAPVPVERRGTTLELEKGDALYASDIIKTQDSAVEIVFADESIATLGPNTTLSIQEFYLHDEQPSFVMELSLGLMRSISGKVVEHNPDAFKVITPRATVGIRGTSFINKVNLNGTEECILLHLEHGHNLVMTTHLGTQASLTAPGQGVVIANDAQYTMTPRSFSLTEIKEILGSILDVFPEILQDFDQERSGDVDFERPTNFEHMRLAIDTKYLEESNTLLLAMGFQAQGIDTVLVGDNTVTDRFGEMTFTLEHVANMDTDLLPHTPLQTEQDVNTPVLSNAGGSSGTLGTPQHTVAVTGGSDVFVDGSLSIDADNHTFTAQEIHITGDIVAAVTISGDTLSMRGGTVYAADDTVVGKNMTNGTLVGDIVTVTGGTLVAGHDQLTLQSKTGGHSIYGDARSISGGTVTFGNDTIIINGDFANSTISGDVNIFDAHAVIVNAWGNDSIRIMQDMGTTQGVLTTLYGDASTVDVVGGDDHVVVGGTMHANSFVYAGGGKDTIFINILSGGHIHAQGGNDTISIATFHKGHIHAGEGADIITVGGHIQGNAGATYDTRIDLGVDTQKDTLYLNGSGTLVLDNFDTHADTLFIQGVAQSVSGNGQYGNYTLIFTTTQSIQAASLAKTAPLINAGKGTASISATEDVSAGAPSLSNEVFIGSAAAETVELGVGQGITKGLIDGAGGGDDITINMGAAVEGAIVIHARHMEHTGESVTLRNTDTSKTSHVSIVDLDGTDDYAANTFKIVGEDITADINTALDNAHTSYTHAGANIIIHFA